MALDQLCRLVLGPRSHLAEQNLPQLAEQTSSWMFLRFSSSHASGKTTWNSASVSTYMQGAVTRTGMPQAGMGRGGIKPLDAAFWWHSDGRANHLRSHTWRGPNLFSEQNLKNSLKISAPNYCESSLVVIWLGTCRHGPRTAWMVMGICRPSRPAQLGSAWLSVRVLTRSSSLLHELSIR